MQIHNHGKNLQVHFQNRADQAKSNSAGEASSAGEAQVQPQRLIERLKGNDEVRQRLLVEVQARVHAGEYNTRVAAEKAAQQIVGE